MIEEWYDIHYPEHTKLKEFGVRPAIIRGEVFSCTMPLVFNPTQDLPAKAYISGLTDALWNLLSAEEQQQVQKEFNRRFNEISTISLLSIKIREYMAPNSGLVFNLVQRAYTDLNTVTRAFITRDPHSVYWSIQQAVEKMLKAFIVFNDPQATEDSLRTKYGHKLSNLLEAGVAFDKNLSQMRRNLQFFDIGPDDRYTVKSRPASEAIKVIDHAFAACHLIACLLLFRLRQPYTIPATGLSSPS